MRHGKKFNHLSRKSAHRKALLSNMASSLIINKRINTTVAKAKALRRYVEPLLTKAKNNTMHSRRTVMSYLQNKHSITVLYGEVASRIENRMGGYTRIIKLGKKRLGDAADMCFMELVDFNDISKKEKAETKTKTRRGRKSKKEPTKNTQDQPVDEKNEIESSPQKSEDKEQ